MPKKAWEKRGIYTNIYINIYMRREKEDTVRFKYYECKTERLKYNDLAPL